MSVFLVDYAKRCSAALLKETKGFSQPAAWNEKVEYQSPAYVPQNCVALTTMTFETHLQTFSVSVFSFS